MQKSFTFENEAKPIWATKTQATSLGVWKDGVSLITEESETERKAGFIPAYRLQKGKRYRITIEPIAKQEDPLSRVFDHPNMTNFECPVCHTNKDAPVVLVPIPGTENDGIWEAKQVHKECFDLVLKMQA